MPKFTLDSMKKLVEQQNRQPLVDQLERELNNAFENAKREFLVCYQREKMAITDQKNHALQKIYDKHNRALTTLADKFRLALNTLESQLSKDYPTDYSWRATSIIQAKNKEHEQIKKEKREELQASQKEEQDALKAEQQEEKKQVEAEETQKERDAHNRLKTQYDATIVKLSPEHNRTKQRLLSDFVNRYIMTGLDQITLGIDSFFSQHPWAADDKELICACFLATAKDTPWENWYQKLTSTLSSAGTSIWSKCKFGILDEYSTFLNQTNPLDPAIKQYDGVCTSTIPKLNLQATALDPYMRAFLYATKQIVPLYVNNHRRGIKSFSYTENESVRSSVDLVFRRIDWLRLLHLLKTRSNHTDRGHLYSILPLSIEEISRFTPEPSIKSILLNVGTEQAPLWILINREARGWSAFLPEGTQFSALQQNIRDALGTLPSNMSPINIQTVAMDGHYLDAPDASSMSSTLIWHAVLGSRVLPFHFGYHVTGSKTLANYRHTIPISSLLEASLTSAILPYINSSTYLNRTGVSYCYSPRSFDISPYLLHQAWAKINYRSKECLSFGIEWYDEKHLQGFLSAIDAGAIIVENRTNAPPTLRVSPTDLILDINPSTRTRSLTRNDFFYLMVLAYHHGIDRLNLEKNLDAMTWQDCQFEFSLQYNGTFPLKSSYATKGVRNLLDCNTQLTTITPLTPALPNVLRHAAACAARNRLMREYFTPEAIKSSTAIEQLWGETGEKVLSLLQTIASFSEEELETHFEQLTNFTGAAAKKGWFHEGCLNQPTPTDRKQKFIWEVAQIAQMDIPGLDLIFTQWEKLPKPLSSLSFDLNCQTLVAHEYIARLCAYAKVYTKNPLPRLNFCMPPKIFNRELATSFADLLVLLDKRGIQEVSKNCNNVYLYNMQSQPALDQLQFLNYLLQEVQSKKIITLIKIPAYDLRVSLTDRAACEAQDVYRQIQNCILNNRRLFKVEEIKQNTEHLQAYAKNRPLPAFTALLDLKEDCVMLPSSVEATYVVGSATNDIQQQLQQAQQKQRQVAQQRQLEVAQKIEVEEEIQIHPYRSRGQTLWTKETIDKEAKTFWEKLPEHIKSLSGIDTTTPAPLKNLFNLWVGSERNAVHVVRYIEQGAAEKIMQHASKFRFGLYHDNLPAGFYLARKEDVLVLCFDATQERDELNQLHIARKNGTMTRRQKSKIILHEPMKAETMPAGDDRQFSMDPVRNRSDEVNPSYWQHLVTEEEKRDSYLDAARTALHETPSTAPQKLVARTQSALQLTAFDAKRQPNTVTQPAVIDFIANWVASLSTQPEFVKLLFSQNTAPRQRSDNPRVEAALHAFGQIMHAYDTKPMREEQHGSYQFMQLAQQIYQTFKETPAYFCIWRDRLLTPSENWVECLQKTEVDAVIQSLRVLKNKPAHAAFWWSLVDAHGQSTGHMQYAPLWSTCYQIFQYIDSQKLQLSPIVLEQLKTTLQANPINGQVFLERLQSVLKHAGQSSINRQDAQDRQQDILNNLSKIDWRHDGMFYAGRYESFPGFWDKDLYTTAFEYASDPKQSSYIPSFDAFHFASDTAAQLKQELTAAIRYAGRHYANDRDQYDSIKSLLKQFWDQTPILPTLSPSIRTDALRLVLMSFILGQNRVDEESLINMQKVFDLCQDPATAAILSKLSHARSIDNVAMREVFWPLRFENLPKLIRALAAPECQPVVDELQKSPDNTIRLAKQAEIAIRCIESSVFKQIAMDKGISDTNGIFERWLEHQQTKPYLKTFPWLILDVLQNEPVFSKQHDDLQALANSGGNEYDRLVRQMHSIDFERSTSLPSIETIRTRLPLSRNMMYAFLSKKLEASHRQEFIKTASTNGCFIIDQGAGFRGLTLEEMNNAEQLFKRRMENTVYFSINAALFKFFVQQIAIPEMSPAETTKLIEKFIDTLFSIHNKVYYNELGQVLGLLVQSVSKKGARANEYYALPQLQEWISSLVNRADTRERHYPVHLLREVLNAPGDQTQMSPGLLKSVDRLHECKANVIDSRNRRNWLKLNQSTLPNQHAALIARLMLRSSELDALSEKVQIAFESKELSPSLMEAFYQFLNQPTVLNEQFPSTDTRQWFDYLSSKPEKGIDAKMYQQAILQLTQHLQQEIIPKHDVNGTIIAGWQLPISTINALWNLVSPEKSRSLLGYTTVNKKDYAQQKLIILAYATQGKFKLPPAVDKLFEKLESGAVSRLIEYYQSGAHLSLEDLNKLLTHPTPLAKVSASKMTDLLHDYETIIQGQTPDGRPKRVYSAEPHALLRVISGFEKKGKGRSPDKEQRQLMNLFYYMNEFSQNSALDKKRFPELQAELQTAREELLRCHPSSNEAQLASARMLACMREVLLRRTGKWANHTQMLALLYAACHNNESLIHQVRTGEGKSIITLMRAGYLALTGDVVDVFSAKESLSSRDYIEAKPVLNAMGIACSYITPESDVENYQQGSEASGDKPAMGAINFATIGNFSLFLSRNAWSDKKKIKINPKRRVAFLDEADHILLDDQTQFNFPEPTGERDAYNFDEWVYREVYKFYCEVLTSDPAFVATRVISRKTHLDSLSQRLVSLTRMMPEDSTFFAKHLLPAMTSKGEARITALKKRDEALVYLIKAAQAAHEMKEGVDFCSGTDQRMLLNQTVPVHILQVMIGNQIQPGATYSDSAQQFACIRKNEEMAKQGEAPDHFVDPDSKIVLSQNCPSVLLNHYRKIEGCTGTAGDTQALLQYENIFKLSHVVKLPTHEEIKTEFKPTQYTTNFDAQVQAIVDCIAHHASIQPMLITCKDDIEVKHLHQAIALEVSKRKLNITLIKDTNDSGKVEAEIVPIAGEIKSVTLSSRMGRGTDIKPKSDRGLYILRTYLASTRVTKQEIGRQGRNGACGVSETIIDLAALHQDYAHYESIPERKLQLDKILNYEITHLEAKIAKHLKKKSHKLDWLIGEDNAITRQNYLKGRALVQFRHQLHEEQHVKLRRQEALIAWMCTGVEKYLRAENATSAASNTIKEEWKECRAAIEKAWHQYSATPDIQTPEARRQQWKRFIEQTAIAWRSVVNALQYQQPLNAENQRWLSEFSVEELLRHHQKDLIQPDKKPLEERPTKELGKVPQLDPFIRFHQQWMEQAVACRERCLAHAPQAAVEAIKTEFDGKNLSGFNELFIQFQKLNPDYFQFPTNLSTKEKDQLFYSLKVELYHFMNSDLLFRMTHKQANELIFKWVDTIKAKFRQPLDDKHSSLLILETLSNLFGANSPAGTASWLPQMRSQQFNVGDPTRYGNLLHLVTDMALSVELSTWETAFQDSNPLIKNFLQHVCQALTHDHWDSLNQANVIDSLRQFFALSGKKIGSEKVIEALAKGFPTQEGVQTLLNLMTKKTASSINGIAFKEYLTQHVVLLREDKYASLLPMITDLTLGESTREINELPAVDAFMHPDLEWADKTFSQNFSAASESEQLLFNQQFWRFLSQRRPLKNTVIQQFYRQIQAHCTLAEAQKILALPPYLSLEFIENRILNKENTSSVFQAEKLECLPISASAFYQWMISQNYITSSDTYTPPIDKMQENAKPWFALFHMLPLEKSHLLFSAMLKFNVPGILPEPLFKQLQTLLKSEPLMLDKSKVEGYCQEMLALTALPDEWRLALAPCLMQFDNKTTPPNRLQFLTRLSQCLDKKDKLGQTLKQFPMQCYQAWERDQFNVEMDSLPLLTALYHKLSAIPNSEAAHQVLFKALSDCMNTPMTEANWRVAIQGVIQWTTVFCNLPKNWQDALKIAIQKASLFDKDRADHWTALFNMLLQYLDNTPSLHNVQTLAPQVLDYWMKLSTLDLADKSQGLQVVLRIAEYPGHPDWKQAMLNTYFHDVTSDTFALSYETLVARKQLMQTFDTLPPQWAPIFSQTTSEILQQNETQKINQWRLFLEILRTELPTALTNDPESITSFFDLLWRNQVSSHFSEDPQAIKEEIKQIISMIQSLKEARGTEKERFIFSEYRLLLTRHDSEKKHQLMALMSDLPKDLPTESYAALWHGVKSGLLSTHVLHQEGPQSTRKAIQLTQRALNDARDNTLREWFIDEETRENRIQLMRGLQHGYLSLGQEKNESCWKYFTNKIRQGLGDFPKRFGRHYHNAAMDSLKRLTQSFNEISLIAQTPAMAEPSESIRSREESFAGLKTRHSQDFTRLQSNYDNASWKNRDRQRQSSRLFDGVLKIDQNLSREEYYNTILNRILLTQKEIIESDQQAFTLRNKKGYSRLYDLSVKMFVSVATDYLFDHCATLPAKEQRVTELQTLLGHSLNAHQAVKTSRYKLFKTPEIAAQHPALQYLNDAIQSIHHTPVQRPGGE